MGGKAIHKVASRIDTDTLRLLVDACAREDRSQAYMVRKLVRDGLILNYSESGASSKAPKAAPPVQPGSQPPPRGTAR